MEDRGKIKLVKIEKEERERGRGFMKRLKSRWDVEFPDQAGLSPQCLRDNAARFTKEVDLSNLVREGGHENVDDGRLQDREECSVVDEEEHEGEPYDNDILGISDSGDEITFLGFESSDVEENQEEMKEEDMELYQLFTRKYNALQKSRVDHMETRERLGKVKHKEFLKVKEKANRILKIYLKESMDITEITDTVYAMGEAVCEILGVKKEKLNNGCRKENRRERKKEKKIRRLRNLLAKVGNELHRRKLKRKATKGEKHILNEIKKEIPNGEMTRL